ncbi:MAG: hypothetical protein F6J86_20925 [Symploca sp. SIO1B1]|nr:hypothetical protein [Symploca sp. SIO2D2]NER96274.1 hypothetical protein [Symploca sp. SIO1B1]
MAKTIDVTEFDTIEATLSEPALHDALQGTVQGECNALMDSASMHSPQCKEFTIKELAQQLKVAKRTAYKYVKDVIEVWYWLSESEFRNEGIYTQFALSEMLKLKEMKSKEAYRELVHDENAVAIQQESQPEVTGGLALITQEDSPFAGLAVHTKASDRVQVLQGELEVISSAADEDFGDFLSITAELEAEDSAWTQQDELEWQTLRKKNAQKWLKRRAILERDKQQILQGDVPLAKKS